VLKVHPNLRYATDDARRRRSSWPADTPVGPICSATEHRADLPLRLDDWPYDAARTGIPTVDVGAAQLAMHSARELMGAHDVAAYSAALHAFLSPEYQAPASR